MNYKIANFLLQVEISHQKSLLIDQPRIVVATPIRALLHINAKNLILKDSLEILVIDEADLMFSFGYEDDVKKVLRYKISILLFFFFNEKLKL